MIPRPFFQRNVVWAEHGKSNFIESILLDLPIAAIYVYLEGSKWAVVDGQQRLTTVFSFMNNEFRLKDMDKLIDLEGCSFEDLNNNHPNFSKILSNYLISITLIRESTRAEIIDMYSRINRYTVNLNDQELRKAAFHNSDFLELSETLAVDNFFELNKFFTPRKRQRMLDVEYVSELLSSLIDGVQDKKNTLDKFYDEYSSIGDKDYYLDKFKEVLLIIGEIFEHTEDEKFPNGDALPFFVKTRFRQQSDFYSLFSMLAQLSEGEKQALDINKIKFRNFLLFYNEFIEPESPINILSQYAIKCVSQANTRKSRLYRYNFLRETLIFVITQKTNKFSENLIQDINSSFKTNYTVNDLRNMLDFTVQIEHDIDDYYEGL